MQLIKISFCIAFLPLALAATCNSSNALPYPVPGSSSSSGGSSSSSSGSGSATAKSADAAASTYTTCANGCIKNSITDMLSCSTACLDTLCTNLCNLKKNPLSNCHSACVADTCAAFSGPNGAQPDAEELRSCYEMSAKISDKTNQATSDLIGKKLKRADGSVLTCSSSQTCYAEKNGNLFCLNKSTGDYTDVSGGNGNVNTGSYTSARVGTPTSTPNKASSTPGSGTAGAAAPATSTVKNFAKRNVEAHVLKGLVGLLMGFML